MNKPSNDRLIGNPRAGQAGPGQAGPGQAGPGQAGPGQGQARQAPVIASICALTLVILKVSVGIYSGAMVLIASAVDSGLDFLVSLFNYFALRAAGKPSDHQFNYGRGKLKAIASTLEGLIIALSSLVILVTAIDDLRDPSGVDHPQAAMVVMVISTLVTAALVFYLQGVARRTGDLVIKADTLHYKMDLYTNLGILAALAVIAATDLYWIDGAFSIVIGLYIFKEAWSLMHEGVMMLMDRALPSELVKQIEDILRNTNPHVSSHHLLKTRRSAEVNFVEVHLVFDSRISLALAHEASEQIEKRIMELNHELWVINCHLDPVDDSRRDRNEQPI